MAQVWLMNPNTTRATTDAMVRIASRTLMPDPDTDWTVVGWTAPEGPGIITSPDTLDAAARHVTGAVFDPAPTGIIVAAFGDPGRDALAARLAVPVIGIGAAAARAAGQGGRRFAVVTTTPHLGARIDALMTANAGAGRYLGCCFARGDTAALMADPRALDAALLEACVRASDIGAEAVIIGGGPLGEAADRLAPQSPVPLIAPITEAARWMRARLRG